MKKWMAVFLGVGVGLFPATRAPAAGTEPASGKKVYVLPIRDDIMPPMVYVVRRGVKQAIDDQADLLLIDMDTNGGRVDSTEEIMEILNRFPGETVTYVNRKAFSAGSFIAVATGKIYMAPQSVIGAAAPIMLSPGGGGVEQMPDTMEVKTISAISALIRTSAEKNGYDPAVVEAMIDKSKELKKWYLSTNDAGQVVTQTNVLSEKGQILTLTDTEAAKAYDEPPKPLLSSGTVASIDELLAQLGYAEAARHEIKPTDMEKLATWLTAISPLLLMVGIIGLYIEFKTPGFGLPGIVGAVAIALYFLGGYVAGLSGAEWVVVFMVGLALVIVELFVFPGTIIVGLAGAALMLVAIVMALMDLYPNPGPGPGLPTIPNLEVQLQIRMRDLLITLVGGGVGIWAFSRVLPKTSIYHTLVSQSASGVATEATLESQQTSRLGQEGVAISPLRPGGKARFGDAVLDVVSQGDLVPKGARVRVIGSRGSDALVEVVE
jgi:membrane-bound serine protease (ClpP class)